MNSSWIDLDDDQKGMVNTNMVITCPVGRNCSELRSTPGANILSPIAMSLTGTIGNAIALFVLYRNSRREQMRTVFYLLVGSLAWTDLTGIVLTTIPVLTVYLNGRWVGSTGLCNYHAFTMISIGLITPCMVCTMAIERFLGIRHGYFYQKHVNRSRVRFILLSQWIVVLIFTSFPFFGFGQYSRQYPGTWCFFDLHATHLLHQAYAFSFAIIIIFLILVIIICNVAVIATLIGMRYRRKHLNSPSLERHVHRSPRQREVEIQMVILLVGITVLFTTCWLPLMIQIILNQIIDYKGDHRNDIYAIRLVSINQTFHPWLYILFRKVIFTKFWKFVRRLVLGKSASKRSLRRPAKNVFQDGRQDSLLRSPNFHVQLPPPDVTSGGGGVVMRGTYCQKCESQYGDGDVMVMQPTRALDSEMKGRDTSRTQNGDGSVTLDDSALDVDDYNDDLNASVSDNFRRSSGSGQVTKCQNCKQVIEKNGTGNQNSPFVLDKAIKDWKPRPEALLSISFLKKHSKRSLPIASEISLNDNCRTVRSAII